jgi:hypothetical protein
MVAAANGHARALQLLIQIGANVHAQDKVRKLNHTLVPIFSFVCLICGRRKRMRLYMPLRVVMSRP